MVQSRAPYPTSIAIAKGVSIFKVSKLRFIKPVKIFAIRKIVNPFVLNASRI